MSGAPERFGRYLFLARLGAGGGGDVHLARDIDRKNGGPIVVVKRLHGRLAERSDFVQRFKHEAALSTIVDSPYVTKVYELGELEEVLYIVQEYIAGWPLSKVAQALADANVRPPLGAVVALAQGMLAGLTALHTAKIGDERLGIVHRDIAPKNIMLRANGEACLIDLGIGKSRLQDWKTATGVVIGSPGYMAPEHVTAKELDHRADLYSMAVTLWELCAVQSYSTGTVGQKMMASAVAKYRALSAVREDCPPALDAVLEKAMAREVEARFESAEAFAAALRAAVPEQGSGAWFVEQMPAETLEREETQLRSLIARPMPSPLPEPLEGGTRTRPSATIYASRVSAASLDAPRPRAPRASWPGIAGAVAAVGIAVSFGAYAWIEHTREAPAPVIAAVAEQAPIVAAPRAQPLLLPSSSEPPSEDREKPAVRTVSQKIAKPAVKIAEPAPPAPAKVREPEISGPEKVTALKARARRLRATVPDAQRARLDDVLSSLMLAGDTLAADPARIANIEKQLDELERAP